MRKTLFLSSVLCFMSTVSYGASTWDGQAQDNQNVVTGADGTKSSVHVFYVRNPDPAETEFHLTTDETKFAISPDQPTAVTATVATAESTAEGAQFYISPNAYGYSRSFASLTITKAIVNKADLQAHILQVF